MISSIRLARLIDTGAITIEEAAAISFAEIRAKRAESQALALWLFATCAIWADVARGIWEATR